MIERLTNQKPLIKHLVPIYIPHAEKNEPELLGTAVYIRMRQYHFLLTAAHVADKQQTVPLYTPGANTCNVLPKFDRLSHAPNNRRREDRLDFAWVRLEETHVAHLDTHFTALPTSRISFDDVTEAGDSYIFYGYYNASYDASSAGMGLQNQIQGYFGEYVQEFRAFKKLGITPVSHIAIPWNQNKSVSMDGQKVVPPEPPGMSGGGVWKFASGKTLLWPHASGLCGIAIERVHRKNLKVLIGTRINFWFESIVAVFPELRPEIDKSRFMDIDTRENAGPTSPTIE